MNSKISEYVKYLSAWCRTRDGDYKFYDLKNIEKELMEIVKQGSTEPIKTFKEKFLNKEIGFPIFCVFLAPAYRKEKYDACMEIITEFEKTHNVF